MAREKSTVSEKIRKKLVALATGAAIVVGLAQAPTCLAEEYTVDKMEVKDVEFCTTPDEAFEKVKERKLGKQNVLEISKMSEIVPKEYCDELYINTFSGKNGIKEFVNRNPQYRRICISNAVELEEFDNIDEYMRLIIEMTRNSTSYAELDVSNSKIYDMILKTEYKFDDNTYGQIYKKDVIEKLKRKGFDVSDTNPPKYMHMLVADILRFKLEKEDVIGMSEAEVIEYANYITTKTAKVDVLDTGIEFTTMNAPRFSVISPVGNQFETKFGDPKFIPEEECRDDVYIALRVKGGSGYWTYDVEVSHYNMLLSKFSEVYGLPEIDMLQYNDGYYIRNTAIIRNINKGLEYQKATEEKGKETAYISNIFENEDMSVYIDESESQESQVLVLLNEYVETDEDNMEIENDNEGLEQENV